MEEGSEQIETGKDRGYLLSAWALTLLLGGVDLIWAERIGLTFVGWSRVYCILIFLLAVGFIYRYSGRDRRLSDAGNYAALWVAFSAAGAISTYLAATFAMPLRDAQFVALDSWMGSRNTEMLWIAMPALIVTTIVSAFLPAVGPYVHYFGRQTADIVVLMTLRAGGAHTFPIDRMQGIITFPSFHTTLAIIFMYVHRPPSRSFVPVAILNGLMLLGIPSEGHHYLVDMISGAMVAAVCIAAVRRGMGPRAEIVSPAIPRERTARVAG